MDGSAYFACSWLFLCVGMLPAAAMAKESDVDAKETDASYTLRYVFDGSVPEGVSAPKSVSGLSPGTTVKLASVAEAEGYTFSGWKLDKELLQRS